MAAKSRERFGGKGQASAKAEIKTQIRTQETGAAPISRRVEKNHGTEATSEDKLSQSNPIQPGGDSKRRKQTINLNCRKEI